MKHPHQNPIRLFGPRVALASPSTNESETSETIIVPGILKGIDYELGEVVAVGDMCLRGLRANVRVPDALQEPDEDGVPRSIPYAEEGDLALFQIPNSIRLSSTYRDRACFQGRKFHVAMQGDLIAIMGKVEDVVRLSIENFTIAGDWVLLEVFQQRDSVILLPENKVDLEEIRFKVLQKGVGVRDGRWDVGDEVYVERSRANPISLSGKEYVFIDKDYVYGKRC